MTNCLGPCLISALDFHEICTQIPAWVNIAIGPRDWHPQFDYPPVRVYRMSGTALTAGVEEHSIDGTPVKVLMRYAAIDRVAKIVRPYIEAMEGWAR